jgi:hypothetical protein
MMKHEERDKKTSCKHSSHGTVTKTCVCCACESIRAHRRDSVDLVLWLLDQSLQRLVLQASLMRDGKCTNPKS